MILNPSCSEVIFRLNMPKKEVLKKLEKVGIKEIEIQNSQLYSSKAFDDKTKTLADIDNPNIPDFDNQAQLWIEDGHSDDETKINKNKTIIQGHQHGQPQLFPTMEKIENAFHKEWDKNGYQEQYEDWKNQDEKETMTQSPESLQKRKDLVMTHFIKGECSKCGRKDKNKTSKALQKAGWKMCYNCHKEICPSCANKSIDSETLFFCSTKCAGEHMAEEL